MHLVGFIIKKLMVTLYSHLSLALPKQVSYF